ncbi:3-oxoacyl-ACP reductase FabG [Rhodococcus opacus]|uniref:3-oxoacyl-ACP reductase FabG n=1 Tax=Rhodococcus opacus TaxID=37919 RepID=A0A2S8J6B5_RHOOP|nr:3-oxoacyl-ACP reductase FabG [Rhodococcus opacus]PQP22568.1 3-oxoacyl-ACP reductase FabG [Rhodococcus opacus]
MSEIALAPELLVTEPGLVAGKVAVVTGAAQGIGYEIAAALSKHGAKVIIADLDQAKADIAAESLGGGDVVALACNVTDEDAVSRVADSAVSQFGSLDIWVNNAGITRDNRMAKMSLSDFELVVNVHMTGTWLGVKTAGAIMREQGRGSIINMSSLSGKGGNFGQTNYSAAKAGIVGMTKASAKELASRAVRVNAIAPGLIRTPMTAAMSAEAFANLESTIPMKRAGEPHEVAGTALFLASDLSSFMTGAVLEVGGGRLM